MYLNNIQLDKLKERLTDLDQSNLNAYFVSDMGVLIPNADVVTLFSNGKLEDATPEFREKLLEKLEFWYKDYIVKPIKESYIKRIGKAIEAWTFEFNIRRLSNIVCNTYFDRNLKKAIIVPVDDYSGYGMVAEIAGAKLALEQFYQAGYSIELAEHIMDNAGFVRKTVIKISFLV